MPPRRPPQTFRAAFEHCLVNRTGIEITYNDVRHREMRRDLDRTLRLGGFAGDEPPGNAALQAVGAPEGKKGSELQKEMSEDLQGPNGLLALVEKLGPINENISSEGFIKQFFKHLNLSQLNIVSLDADLTKFVNLTNLDVSRNGISNVDFLSPNLKFLKVYNNKVTQITCAKQPSLCFLGAGYNALAANGMLQIVQKFRGLMSLDLGYNNLTGLRQFLDDVQALTRLKHLSAAGNPLCLLPYYRLVLIKHLPQLQLLDEQAVGEAEASDAQMVDSGHVEMPPFLNVAISFSQVTFVKRLLAPLAKELPDSKTNDEGVEVPVSEEDRINEVAQKGLLFFRMELPGGGGDTPLALRLKLPGSTVSNDCYIDTTDVGIDEPPPEEPVDPKAKKAPAKGAVEEPPPKPVGEPIDLSGLKCSLKLPPSLAAEAPKAEAPEGAEGEAEAEAPPTETPLFFPLPLTCADDPTGSKGLLQLRDWLRVGMKVKALYRKKKVPIDPDAPNPTSAAEGEEEEVRVPTPEEEEPRLIGGGVLSLSSALWPLISPVSEEIRQEGKLPALPPTYSIGPSALTLAPYARWVDPDVQVPNAPAAKSLSDVSASVTMDVILYEKEPVAEETAEGA